MHTSVTSPERHCRALAVVLGLYLALAVVYSVVNPLFEAPDELWHYGFVQHLRTGRGLPTASPGPIQGPPAQEAAQPPLYYALAAALTFWVPGEDLSEIVDSNPSGSRGHPDTDGNMNMWVLLRPDRFPYSGEFLAAHLARLLSVTLGALTVAATWLVARELAPDRPATWALAAALNAFIPQFLFIASAVSNDALAACTASWGLLVAIRTAQRAPSARHAIALGAIAGLGALAKLSVLGLIPLGLSALAIGASRSRPTRWLWHAALLVGVATAISGWWFARNLVLYGDPLAFRVFVLASGGTGEASFDFGSLPDGLRGLKMSFWALFGWFSIRVEPVIYLAYDVLATAATCGLVIWTTGARAKRSDRLIPAGLALLWLLMIGAALMRYQFYLVAWQGRLLFPAVASTCALLALGLASLPWGRWESVAIAATIGLLVAIAAAAPFRYIAPAYAPPPLLGEHALAAVPHGTYARFGGQLELLGYDLPKAQAIPGEEFELSLYWRAAAPMSHNYVVSVQLFDPTGTRLAQHDSYPGRGSFPTRTWRVGDALRETYRLRLPPTAVGPAVGRILVAVYSPGQPSLPAEDGQGQRVGEVVVARFKIAGPVTAAPAGSGVADLGGEIRLVGYDLETTTVQAGETLGGELRWTAIRPPSADYTVFVQLLGPAGPVAQHDSQPAWGTYPTSFWSPGELVRDEFTIPLGKGLSPGDYRLIAGMYELASGCRLGIGASDFVVLASVHVGQ